MKKVVSAFLALILALSSAAVLSLAADANAYPLKRTDILIRDPYVLVYNGKYYMYGTGAASNGYGCYVSEDLENWSAAVTVFSAPAGFDGNGCYWAPECHQFGGRFYLFATYLSASGGKRGVATFVADAPLGPFKPLSNGFLTPKTRDCIDGTLYVDENNQPWLIYVNEWTSNADSVGEMAVAPLTADLSACAAEPVVLFRASDAKWATGTITDGPFLYKSGSGELLMLWSNFSKKGYAVGVARSSDGTVTGKWIQNRVPLYEKNNINALDGGHGMLFTDLSGQLMLSIHSPNTATETQHETAVFYPVADAGGTLLLKGSSAVSGRFQTALAKILCAVYSILHRLKDLTQI